ncbi:MAG: hypothetical protein GY737_16580 [Desulfobacteraceae bacterium]|nr:hypothetical protein [Desulfobacteraceae bacterium]
MSDTHLPDHYYLRGRECALRGIKSLSSLLSTGLQRLSSDHLELTGRSVHVKVEAWPDWQGLLSFCSPLPCISALLWQEKFTPGMSEPVQLADFMGKYIEPNTRYSCLPAPRFPSVQGLLRDSGLYDLHVHLNGATETDTAWQIFLRKPFDVYQELLKVYQDSKVQEQMEQEAPGIDGPMEIYRLLMTARRIRWGLVHALFHAKYTPELSEPLKNFSTEHFIKSESMVDQMMPPCANHPMHRLFESKPGTPALWSDECLEAMMYVLVMDRLEKGKEEKLAACFHHYLLILGFVNRFLVQQLHQSGFDQFQKITLNGFREAPEKTYARRFFQMHGNHSSNLGFIEGRFAPKNSPMKNIELLNRIIGGWNKFEEKCKKQKVRVPKLQLVCHFIKSPDKSKLTDLPRLGIRHRTLRIQNWQKARALLYVRENYPGVRELVAGVDVAANELEAPPEVFAPIYRLLRKRGMRHFTYHAGEDFHHLIGGMRAIYEAIEFLGMQRGDRIGHGTAAGIEPEIWLKHVGDEFAISEGEWLDDLIFVLHLLEKYPDSPLNSRLAAIRGEVDKRAQRVYRKHYATYSHIQAWLLRRYCPLHMLYEWREAMSMPTWSEEEWRECATENPDTETRELLRLYHQDDCRKRYHRKIRINVQSILSKENLRGLQNLLLGELHKREIVLEALPTSNVRISFYKSHKEHHLWRWLGLSERDGGSERMPAVVIGTDDTGIFSTSILNEYCHIYHQLINGCGQPHDKALDVLRRLTENSKIYSFLTNPSQD